MQLRNLMEKKLLLLDFFLIVYLVYLTLFNKPHWCNVKRSHMTEDCSEDIYGNAYHLWNLLPFIPNGTFMLSTLIMAYFNIKYYIIHKSIKQNINILSSTRKTKLVLVSTLNILHFLFYFLVKDRIIIVDGCSIIKVIFIFIVV